MFETFLNYFSVFAGCTAGILAVVVPLTAICSGIARAYYLWEQGRLRKLNEKMINDQVQEMNDGVTSDGTGTAPFV